MSPPFAVKEGAVEFRRYYAHGLRAVARMTMGLCAMACAKRKSSLFCASRTGCCSIGAALLDENLSCGSQHFVAGCLIWEPYRRWHRMVQHPYSEGIELPCIDNR